VSLIRILPENIANQIAAGEVVERPASVVKELVENALDAGARSIGVYVEGDGSRLIRVIDDGSGMDEDDLLLCLERHATSKIREAADLTAIRTLGFRGEALPSIASVAQLTITSRTAGAQLGSRVEVRFGKVVKVHEMGGAVGTSIEVRQLFGNVPARRKFLKSARTELAHIDEVLSNFFLVHPDKGFSYSVDGRLQYQLPQGSDTLAARMQRLSGEKKNLPLIAIGEGANSDEPEAPLRVAGYLFAPDDAGWRGSKLHLFINGRMVKDRMLAQAVIDGCEGFYMQGRRPAGVILLDVEPGSVDVNVHPTKQEVRFHRPSQVFGTVSAAVRQGLAGFQHELGRHLFGSRPERLAPMGHAAAKSSTPRKQEKEEAVEPLISASPLPFHSSVGSTNQLREPPATGPSYPEAFATGRGWTAEEPAARQAQPSSLRLIGQLHGSYLLCEEGENLLVIDQHAAQERLLYERLLRQYETGTPARQTLLFPVMVELSAGELQLVEYFADTMAGLGFEVQPFGGESLLIKEVPALLGNIDPESLLRDLLARFSEQDTSKGKKSAGRIEEVIAQLACKAAVKANHPLRPEEMESLLQQMREADVFSHCPHGRPTVKRFSAADIRRWFHRT